MKTTIIILSIVLTSIILFSFSGNEKKTIKDGTATIKVIAEKNGVKTVIDTTINFDGEFKESIISELLKSYGIEESSVDQKIIKTIIVDSGDHVEKNIKIVCLENDNSLSEAIKCCYINIDSIKNCCMINADSLKHSIIQQIQSDVYEDGRTCKKICITTNAGEDMKSVLEKEIYIEVNEDGITKQIIINGNNQDSQDSDMKIIKKENGEKIIIIKTNVKEMELDKKESKKLNNSSLKESLKIENLNFSPNPSSGKFYLSFNLIEKGKTKITIVDSNGKTLYKEVLPEFSGEYSKEIDLLNTTKGVYILNIEQGNNMTSKKLVIQ